MGKPSGKKTKATGAKTNDPNLKKNKPVEMKSKAFDEDTAIFISMSQDLKEEGNKLFQKRDHEGAMLKYEKAIKLLPRNHIDVAYLRSNMAACFMQMGPGEYHRAINECNLALEVSPKYSKALLKRARCYESLNRLEWAFRDASLVLSSETNNLMAQEIADRVKQALERKGVKVDEKELLLVPEYIEPMHLSHKLKERKEKTKKKKQSNVCSDKTEDKAVIDEKPKVKEEPPRTMKLVLGEDIRCTQVPGNCSILHMREIVKNRFPGLEALLIKYKDKEGDLVTITTTDELRVAEASFDPRSSIKLYISEVNPDQDPLFEEGRKVEMNRSNPSENGSMYQESEKEPTSVEDWIVQFAHLFKNHVGFNSDEYLDLHDLGMKLYSEAMEDAVTSEEAQELFDIAADKFQEMAALALFNWGNVHMSRARKRLYLSEDGSSESILAQQFEQAKLSWYHAIGSNTDFETWSSTDIIDLFNNAEANMVNGTYIWQQMEARRSMELGNPDNEKEKTVLNKLGLDGLLKDVSMDEAAEREANLRSQINLLWGSMLYERSVVEFKLGIEYWEDCLEAAIEKFEEAGVSPMDIAVMRKNHCSNATAQKGLVFKIDEIVQAWNEMENAKRWLSGVSSFRLEPLLRRRAPRLHCVLESVCC
ncbi:protein PHOX1 isoform X2 [Aristolochia californica]|uniref:protein PHOX1 isoform X2 n=1 Tax=Aristolochia californica TaxID=171875 RepID=UPI0035DFB3B8